MIGTSVGLERAPPSDWLRQPQARRNRAYRSQTQFVVRQFPDQSERLPWLGFALRACHLPQEFSSASRAPSRARHAKRRGELRPLPAWPHNERGLIRLSPYPDKPQKNAGLTRACSREYFKLWALVGRRMHPPHCAIKVVG